MGKVILLLGVIIDNVHAPKEQSPVVSSRYSGINSNFYQIIKAIPQRWER